MHKTTDASIFDAVRSIANTISVIFHPLFLAFVLVALTYRIDEYAYYINDERGIGAFLIMSFFMMVVFPAVSIAMLAGLNFISKVSMPKREDRIIPLIITLALYIWYYINVTNNAAFPNSLRFVSLGLCLSVGASFFINNFTKISLHAVGIAGLTMALGILLMSASKGYIDIDLLFLGEYRVSAIFVLLSCVVLCGCVGTSRLYLRAHHPQEIYGGYLVGCLAQIIAYRIIM